VRWFEQAQIADMVLSARADSQHPGYVALQPIYELLELIARQFKKREQPKSRSSFPPRA